MRERHYRLHVFIWKSLLEKCPVKEISTRFASYSLLQIGSGSFVEFALRTQTRPHLSFSPLLASPRLSSSLLISPHLLSALLAYPRHTSAQLLVTNDSVLKNAVVNIFQCYFYIQNVIQCCQISWNAVNININSILFYI